MSLPAGARWRYNAWTASAIEALAEHVLGGRGELPEEPADE